MFVYEFSIRFLFIVSFGAGTLIIVGLAEELWLSLTGNCELI